MRRIEANNTTRVRSCEDIMDGRMARVEVVTARWTNEPVVLEMDADTARALARSLNRHANFISPRRKRK